MICLLQRVWLADRFALADFKNMKFMSAMLLARRKNSRNPSGYNFFLRYRMQGLLSNLPRNSMCRLWDIVVYPDIH